MSGRGSGGCEGGGQPGSRRRSARQTSKAARDPIAKQEEEFQKKNRAEKAKKAREKKKRKARANSRGNKQQNKNRGAFPGGGQRLDGDPITTTSSGANAVQRLGGSSIDSVYAKETADARVLGLMTSMIEKSDKETSRDLQRQVHLLGQENVNAEKITALCSDEFEIKGIRGGERVDGGTLLGKRGDYEDSPASGKNGNDAIEPGTLCRATYTSFLLKGGGTVEETFEMISESDVAELIKEMFLSEVYRDCLSEGRFPTYKDWFWSMAYHYVKPNDEIGGLNDIFKKICAETDWESVYGVGERNAKRKKV